MCTFPTREIGLGHGLGLGLGLGRARLPLYLLVAVLTALLLGCRPDGPPNVPPGRVASTRNGIDGEAWLAPTAARARAAGAGALEVLGADVASEGDRVGAFVDATAGACVLAMARSSPTVIDVDLYAFEEDGSAFATDESPDPQAALLLCPPTSRRLYVAARVVSGAGIVSLGVMPVPKAAMAAVQKATNARGVAGDDGGRGDAWPGLEARLRAHWATLGGRWDELRRVALPVDPHAATRVSATTEPGRCIDVFVTPSEEVSTIEVTAEDDRGRIVATGRAIGRDRTLLVCSPVTAPIHVAVRPRSTHGLVVVSIARSGAGGDAEIAPFVRVVHLGAALELDKARGAIDKELRAVGYGAAKELAKGAARPGVRVSVPVDLPAGCARVDVVVGRPFSELDAAIWDDHGVMLADVHTGTSGPLFTCGKGGPARVDLEPLESAGPYVVELRKERASPAHLVAHPLAAGRLLGRLAAAGVPIEAAAASAAVPLALEAGTMKALSVTAPPNACTEIVAAADAGGSGVDLRVVDATSREGQVSRGRYVATGRLCGGPSGARGTAELRLESGKTEALVLQRPAPGP